MATQTSVSTRTYAVSLIDRRTGRPHRVNGTALSVFTRHPDEAARELLRHRDHSLWDVRIAPLSTSVH